MKQFEVIYKQGWNPVEKVLGVYSSREEAVRAIRAANFKDSKPKVGMVRIIPIEA